MKAVACTNPRSWMETHTTVYSNKGKVVGEIQSMHLGFSTSQGGEPTVYVAAQRGRNYGVKACHTEMEAYHFLGISTKEVDEYYEVVELKDVPSKFRRRSARARVLIRVWLEEHKFPHLHNKKFYYNGDIYYVYSCTKDADWQLSIYGHYYLWEKRTIHDHVINNS